MWSNLFSGVAPFFNYHFSFNIGIIYKFYVILQNRRFCGDSAKMGCAHFEIIIKTKYYV